MWIKREISEKVHKLGKEKPAILLTGARQTGKSSLLRTLFPKAQYISFDDPILVEEAESNPAAFLNQFDEQVILDEVQYVPILFRYLKLKIDQHIDVKGKWILTGSQKFVLMKEVTETLAGRIGIFELDTLSINELVTSTLDPSNYFLRGGYPELWKNPNLDQKQFFQDYVQTYLERDLRRILDVSNLRSFDRFIRSTAFRVGNLVNYTDLTRDAAITSVTGKNWFQALEASNICYALEPFHANHLKRLIKAPKIYFRDCGLVNYLLNIHSIEALRSSQYHGALFENLVFNQLIRLAEIKNAKRALYYYRDKNNNEVDFLIENGNHLTLIEVKTSENPKEAIENLNKIQKQIGEKYTFRKIVMNKIPSEKIVAIGDVEILNPLLISIPDNLFD